MKNWKKLGKAAIACLTAVFLISGCGVTETLSPGTKGEKEYGKAETMVILTTERLRYEDVYTEEIWTASVDKQGTTFADVLLPQVHDFMIELKTMSRMAEKYEIALTSREKELVAEAAARYYMALGSANAEAFGLKQDAVANLYSDYWISEKLVTKLTGDMNLEVSDSEAKVITLSQIVLSDREKAEKVLALAAEDGADFYSIAKEHSEEDEIKIQIHRGMMGKNLETAAFALEEDSLSEVILEDGRYYILKCMDDYDEEATKLRKDQMIREKKTEAFHTGYQAFKAENPLIGDETFWSSLSVTESPKVEADFFAIYEEVIGTQESL